MVSVVLIDSASLDNSESDLTPRRVAEIAPSHCLPGAKAKASCRFTLAHWTGFGHEADRMSAWGQQHRKAVRRVSIRHRWDMGTMVQLRRKRSWWKCRIVGVGDRSNPR